MKLMSIAGARPNFMKLAAIARAVEAHNKSTTAANNPIAHCIVHTGQHYDQKMSEGFFDDLGIPKPDINLEVGSSTHAVQTAEIMKRFEPVLQTEQPDVLLVVGDVNSTIACTLVASKIEYGKTSAGLPPTRKRPVIVHVEAGLRSFDRDMPEEINRILTDAISDLLFVTEQSGEDNLRNEGIAPEKIHFVGNVMIDTLRQHLEKARQSTIKERFGMRGQLLATPGIIVTEPQGYLDFLKLIQDATLAITDSGGIQEETTVLGIPCITQRQNTERPVTVTVGSNYLIGTDPLKIVQTAGDILVGKCKKGKVPKYWDGQAGQRIIGILTSCIS